VLRPQTEILPTPLV